MELTLKEKLLKTTKLQEFQLILKESNIKEVNELIRWRSFKTFL